MKKTFEKIRKNKIMPYVCVLLVAILAELFVFNFRAWQSLGLKELHYEDYTVSTEGIQVYEDGLYSVETEDNYLQIDGIDAEVKNICLNVTLPTSIDLPYVETGVLNVSMEIKTDGSQYFYQLYNEQLYNEQHKVLPTIPVSQYIWVYASGTTESLRLAFHMDSGYLIQVEDIIINARQPIHFSFIRFAGMVLIGLLIFAFRPKSSYWVGDCHRLTTVQKLMVAGFLLGFTALMWMFSSKNTAYANVNDFYPYQELAWALDEGQVSLLTKPDEALINAYNPYDYLERYYEDIPQKWDYAYYGGNYYVYFGVLPCLVFYLPLYRMTGLNMPDTIPIVFCGVLFAFGVFKLLLELIRGYFPKVPFALYYMLSAVMALGCQFPFYANQPEAYFVPIATAMALTVWGLFFWISSKRTVYHKVSYGRVFLGSLCMALVAGCRPNMLVFSTLALPIFWNYVKERKSPGGSSVLRNGILTILLPYIPVAAGVMYYNVIRFGSPFDFGVVYNLTILDMRHTSFELPKAIIGIYEYLLELPDTAPHFPFLAVMDKYRHYYENARVYTENMTGGLMVCNPILFFVFALWSVRKKEKSMTWCIPWRF